MQDHKMKAGQEALANANEEALKEAAATLQAHHDDLDAWKKAMAEAAASDLPPPAPPATIAGAVATVGNTLGNVALGVGSTAADAAGIVGGTVDALHTGVNDFFSNLRKRLGI